MSRAFGSVRTRRNEVSPFRALTQLSIVLSNVSYIIRRNEVSPFRALTPFLFLKTISALDLVEMK